MLVLPYVRKFVHQRLAHVFVGNGKVVRYANVVAYRPVFERVGWNKSHTVKINTCTEYVGSYGLFGRGKRSARQASGDVA